MWASTPQYSPDQGCGEIRRTSGASIGGSSRYGRRAVASLTNVTAQDWCKSKRYPPEQTFQNWAAERPSLLRNQWPNFAGGDTSGDRRANGETSSGAISHAEYGRLRGAERQ
jgi:hypothetical protein